MVITHQVISLSSHLVSSSHLTSLVSVIQQILRHLSLISCWFYVVKKKQKQKTSLGQEYAKICTLE